MKFAAMTLALLLSAVLAGEGFQALARHQTDWYSRGIVRGQTIKVMTAKQKREQHLRRKQALKRKKRKAHAPANRHQH